MYKNGYSQAFTPCPSCGDLKKKTSKLCKKCHQSQGFPRTLRYIRRPDNPCDGIVYKITNNLNGKIYVGKTVIGHEKRWAQHLANARQGESSYLYRAIRKYGAENFVTEVIDAAATEGELDSKEIAWISKLEATRPDKGYNCTVGGDGQTHSEASRTRMKGRKRSPEAIANIVKANTGRKWTEAQRANFSVSRKGVKQSPEVVVKRTEAIREFWKNNPERRVQVGEKTRMNAPLSRDKRSVIAKQRWTQSSREEWSQRMRVQWAAADATRQACKDKSKAWWDSHPEAKNKMRDRTWSEESREKARAAANKGWAMRRVG